MGERGDASSLPMTGSKQKSLSVVDPVHLYIILSCLSAVSLSIEAIPSDLSLLESQISIAPLSCRRSNVCGYFVLLCYWRGLLLRVESILRESS